MLNMEESRSSAAHISRGRWGENLAALHMKALGYSIIERNWRYQKLEIDLIVYSDNQWVFVEVKTRKIGYLESALAAVDNRKQERIIRAAHQFICRTAIADSETIRFDIICVEYSPLKWRIEHIPDAFISLP